MITGPKLPRREAQLLFLAALFGLSGCAEAKPPNEAWLRQRRTPELAGFRVSHPGLVLIDGETRRQILTRLPVATRTTLCGERDSFSVRPVVEDLGADAGDGPDVRSQWFALTMMEAAAAYLAADDPKAPRDALLGNLDRWAEEKALLDFDRRSENAYYALDRTLMPTITAWSLLRDDPAVEKKQRRRIDRWLERLVRARGDRRPARGATGISTRNNHAYLAASVDMAWGALEGDDDYFRSGPRTYRMAIRDMRPDGSLPLETARGARAPLVPAPRHRLAHHDRRDGRRPGLRPLRPQRRWPQPGPRGPLSLDAIADPTLVEAYAAANYKPGPAPDRPDQDLGFLRRRGRVRHYMAWAEYLIARFPEREDSRRLLKLLSDTDPNFRPMVDDYSGGNTTCFVADPATV